MSEAVAKKGWEFSTNIWAIPIVGAVGLTIFVSLATFSYFVKSYPKYQVGDFLGFWGLAVGVLGVLISIVGFTFGLVQLRKTQGAAEASSQAINRVRKDYASFDLTSLISSTRAAAIDAGKHLGSGRFAEMALCYTTIRSNLWRIASTRGIISDFYRDELKDLAGQATEAYLRTDARAADPASELDEETLKRWLQLLDNKLTEVDLELRSDINGH